MTEVTNITGRNGQSIVDGALDALTEFAATLGLAVEQKGRWGYDNSGRILDLTIRFTVGGQQGIEEKEAEDFAKWAKYYDLEAGDYGAILTIRGKKYKLTKINSRRGVRFPYECDALDGSGRVLRLARDYLPMIKAARK